MNAVLKAILKSTRPEGMTISERKRRDRVLLLAVLAGWFAFLFEGLVLYLYSNRHHGDFEFIAFVFGASPVYFALMLLAALQFFVLYGRTSRKVARVVTVTAGSVILPSLPLLPIILLTLFAGALFGSLTRNGVTDAIEIVLVWSGIEVLPALIVFLIVTRSEFFKGNRKGDGAAGALVALCPTPKDRTTSSGQIEFSYS